MIRIRPEQKVWSIIYVYISQKPTFVEPQSFFHRIVHTSAKKEGANEKILRPQEVGQIRIRIRTVIRTVQKSHATHTL